LLHIYTFLIFFPDILFSITLIADIEYDILLIRFVLNFTYTMGVYSVKTHKNSIQHKLIAHHYFFSVIFDCGERDLNDYDDISPKKKKTT